jgi:hypothetical protein
LSAADHACLHRQFCHRSNKEVWASLSGWLKDANRTLKDIDLKTYPALQQLNAVVGQARAAIAAYQKENPDWFKTDTDSLTKSLGCRSDVSSKTRLCSQDASYI